MRFKCNKVWVFVDKHGNPLLEGGKALIKYRKSHDENYEYRVFANKLKSLEEPVTDEEKSEARKAPYKKPEAGDAHETPPPNAILIYTDGASSGNPGPSGIGVLMRYKDHQKEISRFIGRATNNIAELMAIKAGLQELQRTDLPVRIYTDSGYAYGLLALGWKAHRNEKLVESITQLVKKFSDLKLIKVKGHAGHEGNERADFLATSAIKRESRNQNYNS